MRTRVLNLLLAGGMLLAVPCTASAVNCDQVRRYLSTGRSVEDVADTMVISPDDVKKCQQGGAGEQKPAPTPPGGGQPKTGS